jgi:integrase
VNFSPSYVIPGPAAPRGRDWRRWFEDAVEAAEIPDFHYHDLRHTFGSRLVMKGVDLRTVMELMGHSDITMTMRYAHLAQSHVRDAVERLAEKPTTVASTDTKTDTKPDPATARQRAFVS